MITIPEEIKSISEIINQNCKSEKIILFGSYAKGTATSDSDIDICIITKSNDRKINILRTLRKALYNYISKPLDLLVYTPQEFQERATSLKSIEREIQNEGIALYG